MQRIQSEKNTSLSRSTSEMRVHRSRVAYTSDIGTHCSTRPRHQTELAATEHQTMVIWQLVVTSSITCHNILQNVSY